MSWEGARSVKDTDFLFSVFSMVSHSRDPDAFPARMMNHRKEDDRSAVV
jgi:hypothetical protein